jgi:ADP-ribose pyrophosphatase YjhB (NUDIX family)
MPHLYYYLDFTVSIFVVYERKVLLVDHKQLRKWLPIGGHIEPGEDPEQAAYRETAEESGLEIELIGDKPPGEFPGTKLLVQSRVVEYYFFGGYKHEEIADILGVSIDTIRRDWRLAKAWLSGQLKR